uniref:Uncharacterized protein n=1 Tax=Solanum lycopersicum TaxID=4081 RepID=K4CZY0_SOLLC
MLAFQIVLEDLFSFENYCPYKKSIITYKRGELQSRCSLLTYGYPTNILSFFLFQREFLFSFS